MSALREVGVSGTPAKAQVEQGLPLRLGDGLDGLPRSSHPAPEQGFDVGSRAPEPLPGLETRSLQNRQRPAFGVTARCQE